MKQYVLLIQNRSDTGDRYWIIRNSLEDALRSKREYTKDMKYDVYIHILGESI